MWAQQAQTRLPIFAKLIHKISVATFMVYIKYVGNGTDHAFQKNELSNNFIFRAIFKNLFSYESVFLQVNNFDYLKIAIQSKKKIKIKTLSFLELFLKIFFHVSFAGGWIFPQCFNGMHHALPKHEKPRYFVISLDFRKISYCVF